MFRPHKDMPTKGLRRRLIRQITAFVILVMAVGIVATSVMLQQVITAKEMSSLDALAHAYLRDLDLRLSFLGENIAQLSKNRFVTNSLIDPQGRSLYLPQFIQEFDKTPFVAQTTIVDFAGEIIYSSSGSGETPKYLQHPNLRTTLAMGKQTFHLLEKEMQLVIMQPIQYYQTTQGAVVVLVDLAAIVQEALPPPSDHLYKLYQGEVSFFAANERPGIKYVTHRHQHDKDGGDSYAQRLGLSFEIGVPRNEFLQPIRTAALRLLLLGALFVVLAILVASRLGNQMAQPILQLCGKVRESGASQKALPCSPVGTDDELEDLALAFDERTVQLLRAQEELHKKNELLQLEVFQRRHAEESLQAAYDDLEERIRKRTQDLSDAQESLNRAQEIAHLGNWDWDIATNHLWWSDEIYRIFGRQRQSFTPTHEAFLATIHPDDREAVEKSINETLTSKQPYHIEHRVILPDGRQRYILEQGELLLDHSGMPSRLMGTVLDLTERKEAEILVKEAEIRYRTLFEQSPDGICLIDPETALPMAFNETAHRQLGYSREEFSRLRVSEYEAKEMPEEIQRRIAHLLEHGRDDFETLHRRKNGELRHIVVTVKVITLGGQAVFLTIFRDVTRLKRAEEEIKLKAQLLDAANDTILLHDLDGKIIEANEAAYRVRGYEKEEFLALNIKDLDAPDFAEKFPNRSQEMLEHGHAKFEAAHICKDGTRIPLDINAKLIEVGGKKLVLSVARDIRARKEAEEKLNRFTQELERSNKELQQFAYVASHDLQEPLRKIMAFGDRLKKHGAAALDGRSLDYLDRMQNAAGRMRDLIDGLLQFSRVTTKGTPFESVDLNEVVGEVLTDLEERLAQSNGQVEVEPLPKINGDRLQMRQLFQNLIANSLKYQAPGEQVPKVTVSGTETVDGWGEIMVSDNGIGFDEKYLDRIFIPFQRLHARDEYEGTGMGLAICDKIVTRHGGTITARSTVGQGATFIIRLPLQPQGKEAGHEQS